MRPPPDDGGPEEPAEDDVMDTSEIVLCKDPGCRRCGGTGTYLVEAGRRTIEMTCPASAVDPA